MSILIKDRRVPTSCYDNCPCQGIHWCNLLGRDTAEMINTGKRFDDCPLVPIPPHGDLIELNSVMETVTEWCPDDDGSVGKIGDLREVLNEIEDLPILIEAEG